MTRVKIGVGPGTGRNGKQETFLVGEERISCLIKKFWELSLQSYGNTRKIREEKRFREEQIAKKNREKGKVR